jgi:cellulose biosynthesis protein BcsQ
MISDEPLGQVITFYSYKGGTGRSMALANLACILAARQNEEKGKGVLIVDWDLEAPGVHTFFFRDETDSKFNQQSGLIDLFLEIKKITCDRFLDQEQTEEEVINLLDDIRTEQYILSTDEPCLYILKAGRFDKGYSTNVNTFDWEELYKRSPHLFRLFAEHLARKYQYVLIDSRTGLTDISGICTTLLPEKLVVVFTPNRQSLSGLAELIRRATNYRKQTDDLRPLAIFPLPSRIELDETELREDWRCGNTKKRINGYQPQFEKLFKEIYDLPECDLNNYFNEVQIRHASRFAYGEEIAVKIEASEDSLSLTRSFKTFTDCLVTLSGPWEDLKSARRVKFPLPEIPPYYKTWVEDRCSTIEIDKLREKSAVIQVRLPEIFIPLYAYSWERKSDVGRGRKEYLDKGTKDEERPDNIEDLIVKSEALLIEGQAASGKTTLLKHFAYSATRDMYYRGLDCHLTILIFLKDLKSFFDTHQDIVASPAVAESILSSYFQITGNGLDLDVVKAFLEEGKALFLVDGLDAIDPKSRKIVVDSLADLMTRYRGNKLVLSSRPHGIEGPAATRLGKFLIRILPLNTSQRDQFIKNWFDYAYAIGSQTGHKTAEDMIGEISAHPATAALTENPLMLTAVCMLYHDGKELPGQRAELYRKFIYSLLYKRFEDYEKVLEYLETFAHAMHTRGTRSADRAFAVTVMEGVFRRQDAGTEKEYRKRLEKTFDEIEQKCGLLKFEDGQYLFWHLTFQEFLTAVCLVDNHTDYTAAIRDYWGDEHYKEVIQLYIGYLSIENKKWANEIIRQAVTREEGAPGTWMLASKSLLDIQRDRREPDLVETVRKRLLAVIGSSNEPKVFVDAGETLGWLSDPRDLREFVPIEGGIYKLSTGKFTIKAFELGKHPLTNAWFGEFIDAGGYHKREYWTPEGLKWLADSNAQYPRFWHERKWTCPNAPVVGVSWYEAAAFTRWLTLTLNDGYTYRLPDETEWEAAASGFEGREYPWGKGWDRKRCNNGELGLQRTSPVGVFTKGETSEGVTDMAGNIWEWTVTDYESRRALDDVTFEAEWSKVLQRPVVRGGSWGYHGDYCRCASRSRIPPIIRNNSTGFRCARDVK